MWLPKKNCQFAKILIECDEDAGFAMRNGQDFLVARIFIPISSPNNLMACGFQCPHRPVPYTSVQQDFHAAVPNTNNSTRSRATNRLAYNRQARISSGSRNG